MSPVAWYDSREVVTNKRNLLFSYTFSHTLVSYQLVGIIESWVPAHTTVNLQRSRCYDIVILASHYVCLRAGTARCILGLSGLLNPPPYGRTPCHCVAIGDALQNSAEFYL